MREIILTTLLGLLIFYGMAFASPGFENFTTYTEVDVPNRVTIGATSTSWANLDSDEDVYVYSDKGAGHFSGDFEHLEKINQNPGVNAYLASWMVSVATGTYGYIKNTISSDAIAVLNEGNVNLELLLCELNAGVQACDTSIALALNTNYWFTIERDEAIGANGTVTLLVYDDGPARTNEVDGLSRALSEKQYIA